MGVNRANSRNKLNPLSGPNIYQIDKLKERKELIDKVNKRIENRTKKLIAQKKINMSKDSPLIKFEKSNEKINTDIASETGSPELVHHNSIPRRPKLLRILNAKRNQK